MKDNKDDSYIPTPEEQALIDDDVKKITEELKKDPHALDNLGPAVTIVVDNPKDFDGFTFGEVEFAEEYSNEIETAQILNLDGSEWHFDGDECVAHFDNESEAERVSKLLAAYDIDFTLKFNTTQK